MLAKHSTASSETGGKGHEHNNEREIEEREESGSRTQNNSENKCVF